MLKMKYNKYILGFLAGITACAGGIATKRPSLTRQNVYADSSLYSAMKEHEGLDIRAKAAYLMDYSTQTPIFSKNEQVHLPIASMCKIMTLILAFERIESGDLRLDEEIMVSERAASMGGSQVFLEAHEKYSVSELLKSIIVCSANDSCVAIAERVAGSETLFVESMNKKVRELGANDTLFANCTGLPQEPQYSCAKDVAIMLKALLGYEQYYQYGNVWMDKFQHPEGRYTEITNTNKLVRFYDGCDGGKTGFTNEAGFCLAATAKRNNMRIVSVVIGEENSKNRFEDVRIMFDFAFANYTSTPIFKAGEVIENTVKVDSGKEKFVEVYPKENVDVFMKRGEKANVTFETNFYKVKAPLKCGDCVGELIVYNAGVETDRVPLLASKDVAKATLIDRIRDVGRGWSVR